MIDLILNSNGQVDFGESTGEHIQDLLILCKGWHKFSPFIGACVGDNLNDDTTSLPASQQLIRSELRQDGLRVHKLRYVAVNDKTNLEIDADYNS